MLRLSKCRRTGLSVHRGRHTFARYGRLSPIHTADADTTQLSSWVASALWTHPSAVMTQFIISCAVGDKWRHTDVIVGKVINIDQNPRSQAAMESLWQVSKLSTESVGSRRELVANGVESVHTADADATQLDSWVASASAVCTGP